MRKCNRCEGTGFLSAAKESGWSEEEILRSPYTAPIGVFYCPLCNGAGKLPELREIVNNNPNNNDILNEDNNNKS